MKNINKILGVIIIIVNLYFIPVTLINVKESGGQWVLVYSFYQLPY